MLKEFMAVLAKAGTVFVERGRPFFASAMVAQPKGEPDNQVVRLAWKPVPNVQCAVILTEAGIEAGKFDKKAGLFRFIDEEGDNVNVRLCLDGESLGPADGDCYVVLQEGGSTGELYTRVYDDEADANESVQSCSDAAYNTSAPVAIPASLANHPDFGDALQALARAGYNLGAGIEEGA